MPRVFRPEQLSMNAFSLYEHFRPAIAAEVRGWGAKGNLDIVDHVDHVDQLRAGFRGVTRRKLTPTKTLDFPTLSLRTRRPGVRISPGAPFACQTLRAFEKPRRSGHLEIQNCLKGRFTRQPLLANPPQCSAPCTLRRIR